MSSRQMRRMQDLVDRATGLDASEEEEDETMPATMQTKKSADRHHDKKKQKKEKEKHHKKALEADAAPAEKTKKSDQHHHHQHKTAQHSSSVPAPAPAAPAVPLSSVPATEGSSAPPKSPAAAAEDWEEVEDDNVEDGTHRQQQQQGEASDATAQTAASKKAAAEAAARAAAVAEEEKRRKKEEKRKLRQQQQRQMQAEEDALLDAVLAHQADPSAGPATGEPSSRPGLHSSPASPNSASSGGAHHHHYDASASGAAADADSLQHFVMACDPQQLDTRLERIRMFGVDAVEDVGDGRTPHRRADGRTRDSGTVSFFPPHHLHVKFVQSALATPNRYRWVPYDSLGVYLTTEEGHGTQGQPMWRDYTLNCESNAFQRALAALNACQERMGGVQELVECLAQNKVYHIPTLLQCVYTMEATGENAFAGELLEVALYQVGVILRRFALSGTWAQRRLPMARGGNALIFQVLQRGVHAALKKGCLRTAFERTRCLLSLDAQDPCGMLLLLDYTALRAKRWAWLLELRHRVMAADGASSDSTLSRSIKALPNYAFSCALAKHFIEREEKRQAEEAQQSGGRPSKVLRGMADTQRTVLEHTPSAEELLTTAIVKFPHAAVRLVNALGGVETVCGGGDDIPVLDHSLWFGTVVASAEDESRDGAAQQQRIAELFVARHEELWKLNECISLLRSVVQKLVYAPAERHDTPSSPITQSSPLLDPYAYVDLTQEAVLGASVAPIPADLLRPDAAELAMMEGEELNVPGIDQNVMDELVRLMQQHRDNAGEQMAAARQYLEQLGHRLMGGEAAEGEQGRGEEDGSGEERDVEWYDYDDEETQDVAAQEWYSVASEDDRHSDEGADGANA